MEKVKELPDIYQKVAEKTKDLDKVVEFYSAFVVFTFGRQYDGGCVSIIKYMIGMSSDIISSMRNTCFYYYPNNEKIYTSVLNCKTSLQIKEIRRHMNILTGKRRCR